MAQSKRPGRPSTVRKSPGTVRQIPLALKHADVLRLDRAAAAAGVSRAAYVRKRLGVRS
jgi:hypothetical protein